MTGGADLKTLTYEEARSFYDRFGSKQDRQALYERVAIDQLCSLANFPSAHSVLEFGCGTGTLAARLLKEELDSNAGYLGLDLSSTMVALARARTAPFAGRAEIRLTDGSPIFDVPNGSFDRFVSCYVLDLLSSNDIQATFKEAARVLEPGGLLCLAGLTFGDTRSSRAVSRSWRWLHARRPDLVGGCRPIEVAELLPGANWKIRERRVVSSFSIASEVMIAERTSFTASSVSQLPCR